MNGERYPTGLVDIFLICFSGIFAAICILNELSILQLLVHPLIVVSVLFCQNTEREYNECDENSVVFVDYCSGE